MASESNVVQGARQNIVGFRRVSPTVLSRTVVPVSVCDADTRRSPEDGCRIKYSPEPSDVIMERYRVGGFVGEGGFTAVYKVTDVYTGTIAAVKVFHKGQMPHRGIGTEELVYTRLVAGCSANIRLFAEVMDSGEHQGHRFLVLEMCGPTLEIAFQLFQGVAYLHSLGFIHTDLKPDNIALKNSGVVPLRYFDPAEGFRTCHQLISTQICILDLGGVVAENEDGNEESVGVVNYRAPEISLGLPFDHSADSFSAGCVLAEIHLGRELFPGDVASSREHVALVERICGPFPFELAVDVEQVRPGTFHIQDSSVSVPFPGEEFDASVHTEPLRRLQCAKPVAFQVHDIALGNLLRRLLDTDPCKRMELSQALRHTYFDDLRCRQM